MEAAAAGHVFLAGSRPDIQAPLAVRNGNDRSTRSRSRATRRPCALGRALHSVQPVLGQQPRGAGGHEGIVGAADGEELLVELGLG